MAVSLNPMAKLSLHQKLVAVVYMNFLRYCGDFTKNSDKLKPRLGRLRQTQTPITKKIPSTPALMARMEGLRLRKNVFDLLNLLVSGTLFEPKEAITIFLSH